MRRALDAEEDIEAAADESETLVHITTGRLILVGNDALVGIRQIVGGVVDERFGPFAPLLKRLLLLENPNSFYDLLRSFARHFQRDHWKSLWADVGTAFKTRPEEIAQSLLTIFLQGQFGGMAFVGRELGNGDGFVDVLVNFLGTMPRVIVALEAELERVLDLRDGEVRRMLVVSEKRMLTERWREEQTKGCEALTQAIGRLAYDLDVQALLVPSAAMKGGSNLIVFPANLHPPKSWLRIVNRDELPRKG